MGGIILVIIVVFVSVMIRKVATIARLPVLTGPHQAFRLFQPLQVPALRIEKEKWSSVILCAARSSLL